MIYFLFISLIIMIIMAYILNGKDILSPWFISIAVFILSTAVTMLNIKKWEVSLSLSTCLVIIFGLLAFGAGEVLVRCCINYLYKTADKKGKTIYMENEHEIEIPAIWTLLVIAFTAVVTALYFKETYNTSLLGGNPGGYSLMLKYARAVRLDVTITGYENRILAYMRIVSSATSYFFGYVFLYNTVLYKFKKKDILYIIPTLLYCVQVTLTAGRIDFIYLITAYLVMWILLIKKKHSWSTKNDAKIIKMGLLCMGTFLFCFYLLGTFTGKTKALNLFDTISVYVGSPIAALNVFINSPKPQPVVFGEETLFNVYAILRKIGISAFNQSRNLENVYLGTFATNVFTVFRRYIYDYSVTGMLIIQFLLGCLYSSAQLYIKYHKKINIVLIIFALYFYPITLQSIDELFLSSVISVATIYRIILVALIYWFFVDRKIKFKLD